MTITSYPMANIDDMKKKLHEVAQRDDKITEEENYLLEKIDTFVRQFKLYQQKANEDNVIDEEERKRLKEMKSGILEGAWVAANEDGRVSEDESELISELYEFLKTIEI